MTFRALPFRILAWNIRAGGGKRADLIADAIVKAAPDVIVLSEFRNTPPSRHIAGRLRDAGWCYQRDTTDQVAGDREHGHMSRNALLIAARTPFRRVVLRSPPAEPGRWLMIRLEEPRVAIGGMYLPNHHTGRKQPFQQAVLGLMRRWRGGPAVLIGDTNSGRIGIDEQNHGVFDRASDRWFDQIEVAGWRDAFRYLHDNRREYTWFSPGHDNGFRLDQAFVGLDLAPNISRVSHKWVRAEGTNRRDAVSDHAALVVDLRLARGSG